MAVIAFLEQLGGSDGLTRLLGTGGELGIVGFFLWKLHPYVQRWLEAQIEMTKDVHAHMEAGQKREELILSLIEKLPCQAVPPRTYTHPSPGGGGNFNPNQQANDLRTSAPDGPGSAPGVPADRA